MGKRDSQKTLELDNQQPRLEQSKVHRLSRKGVLFVTDHNLKEKVGCHLHYFYCLLDENLKIRYIGVTVYIKHRLKNHLKYIKSPRRHKDRWIKFMLSSGYTPTLKVISKKYCSRKEALIHENYLIKLALKKGYKLTNYNGVFKDETSSGSFVPIIAFNVDGSIYKRYDSVSACAQDLNKAACSITSCLKGRKIRIGNKQFVYEHLFDPHKDYSYKNLFKVKDFTWPEWRKIEFKIKQKETCKPIEKYSLKGEYICTYNCVEDVLTEEDIKAKTKTVTNIRKVALGERKSSCGYIWKYVVAKDIVKS